MEASRPRVFDCFTFNGEHDLLRLRMQALRGVVDYAVIAEADRTFTGKRKPLRFDPGMLPSGGPKVVYLPVTDLEENPASAWANENRQRNALGRILTQPPPEIHAGVRDEDRILLSDVDEIPHPQRLADFRPEHYRSAVLVQRNFVYAFNNLALADDGAPLLWQRARLTTAGHFRRWFGSMQRLRDFRRQGPMRGLARAWNKLRTQRLQDAGWHFSYLMTPEQIIEKLASFSHQEFNTPEIASLDHIRRCVQEGKDMFSGRRLRVVPLDSSFPAALLRERGRYEKFIWS
jgi:beta-1,4-mannosyl-glycoprotein beta-1,4-N-acetylglucosaminyltransferase